MQPGTPAKLLRIHITDTDRYQGKPLHEAIVALCRELHIAGATVFRGLEGFGETGSLRGHPIVITIVDSADNMARLVPAVEPMVQTGLLAISDVQVTRVQKV